MSDTDSIFSDNSETEHFPEDLLDNIPEDSDDGDEEGYTENLENNSDSSSPPLTLEVGLTFLTWKSAFDHIKQWSLQQGFFIRKGRSEKLLNERRKQTILCRCQGVNTKTKKNQTNPSKSHRTNCKWHVNLSCPVKDNPNKTIFITTLFNEHFGHSLDPTMCQFEMSKTFTKPMLDDIEWMCLYGRLKPLSIKRMLKAKYNRKVYNQDLYKVIYKYHRANPQLGNDVSRLFEYLEKLKEEDSRWIIYKDWDHETNTLTKIFWMSPKQIEIWTRYHDVILNDNTAKTNRYELSLSFFVAVDNNMKSRIVAQALMDRETKDAYAWVLQCTLDATGIPPKVFITDADPGMDAAIQLKYSLTFPIHCIWHISQNLPLRLKSKLGGLFERFKRDFYECHNSLDQITFEQRWLALCNKYPDAVNYLERSLYPSKASWARAFSNNIFTIDIQTTSRCESVNATFKRLLYNSNTTLIDIFLTVEERLAEEQDNNDYTNWRDTLPYTQSETLISNAFTNIDAELKEFTTSQIHKLHCNEMEMSFSYDAKTLDQSYINNENLQDWSFADDFIEKQEIRQITFQQLLMSCDQPSIKSLWGVNYITSSKIHHLVILLNNGTYKCSCLSLITCGIVCKHYFSVMLRTSHAQFHIGFLNSRWFKSSHLDLKSRPFYPASKFMMDMDTPHFEPNDIGLFNLANNNSTSNNNQYASFNQQRSYYMSVQGLVKQANQIACKTCDEDFIILLQEYINDKNHEALNNQISTPNLDQENTNQIGNPLIRRPKGRPTGTSRFKGPLENSTKSNSAGNRTQNKCGLCNNVGHNRATCPSNPSRKKKRMV